MKEPNDLLSAVSDELGRRIKALATGVDNGLRSASPALKTLPGFPYTLVSLNPETQSEEGEADFRPFPVIWDIVRENGVRYVRFFLGNASSGKEYPVKFPLNEAGKQFFFLRVEATVNSVCQCLSDPGDPPEYICVDEDVVTDNITVITLGSLPAQQNPTVYPPCGSATEGSGWGSFYGSPSGSYVVYLPLLCFDFTLGFNSVSYISNKLTTFITKNPQYTQLLTSAFLGGDSARLWWSNGSPYSNVDVISAGDPAALSIDGLSAQPLDPGDSPFILRSL